MDRPSQNSWNLMAKVLDPFRNVQLGTTEECMPNRSFFSVTGQRVLKNFLMESFIGHFIKVFFSLVNLDVKMWPVQFFLSNYLNPIHLDWVV